MCSFGDHDRDNHCAFLDQVVSGVLPRLDNDDSPQLPVQKTFARKGRPHRSSDRSSQRVQTQAILKDPTHQHQPTFRAVRSLKQTHLDLGQADFHCRTCVLCGMTYAPGEEADEKLHAAHHAKLVQGIQFHGWQNERVLHRDGLSGCVLLVLPTDPAPHLKKVKEIAELLEDQLGLVHGWLMSVPCKVYLYVSASKHLVGCVMLQSIQSACPAVPTEDPAASTGDSSAGEVRGTASLSAQLLPTGGPMTAGLSAWTHTIPRPQNCIFLSVGFAVSTMQECSDTPAVGRSVFSEPAKLEGQGRGPLQASTPVGLSRKTAIDGSLAASRLPELCHTAPVKSRKRSWAPLGALGSKRASLGNPSDAERQSRAQLQRQQGILSGWLASGEERSKKQEAARDNYSMAAPPSPSGSCCSGATRPLPHARLQPQHANMRMQRSGCLQSISAAESQEEVKHDSTGSKHMVCEQSSVLMQQQVARQLSRVIKQRAPDLRGQGQAPLLVDESRKVPAVCGVRVVWVSVDARRQGIASKLLDLARCNFLAGYVVPRHELAFSQPTEQGRSFAASYTGSQKLLVYM